MLKKLIRTNCLLPVLILLGVSLLAQSSSPNIILIIADDLGYKDLGCYGNQLARTPHIDSLAASGFRFTQAYVTSPICAPSREAIFTGRYQQRFGNEFMPYDALDPGIVKKLRQQYLYLDKKSAGLKNLKPHMLVKRKGFHDGLPASEITIAKLLQQHDYATGLIGKWNLGVGDGYYPDQHGFDYSYYFEGALSRYVEDGTDTNRYVEQHLPWSFSEMPAWAPRYGSTAIKEGRKEMRDTGYLTFSFANKAMAFIEKNYKQPFFLTISFNAPHDPFQVPKEYFDKMRHIPDTLHRVYNGMIAAMDDAIGQVFFQLEALGIAQNTVIIFISDNGGATYTRAANNKPLMGGKCTHFDGGLKVPFIIHYPAKFHSAIEYIQPVSSLDIFTSIAAITNASLPADRVYDGIDLFSFIENDQADTILPHPALYFRNGYSKAIRVDEWKLFLNKKSKASYLFNVKNDPQELHDLSNENPAKVKALRQQLKQWEKTQWIKHRWRSNADVLVDVDGRKYYFPT